VRATKAYIASLGTTGVLLAASILMLAVVSAVVAFDAWPGTTVAAPPHTLVLADRPAPIRVTTHSTAPPATPAARRAAAAAVTRRATAAPPAGVRTGSGPRAGINPTPPPRTPIAAVPAPVAKPLQTVQQTATPLFSAVSSPATTASQIADGAQAVTDTAGVSVGKVNPDLGTAVSGTGQAAAQTVRQLPLPQSLVPGQ
jgi:hypothetical protein